MLKKLWRHRDTFRQKPTDDSDSDLYDAMPSSKPVTPQPATFRTLYYAQQTQDRALVPLPGKPFPRLGSGNVTASRPTQTHPSRGTGQLAPPPPRCSWLSETSTRTNCGAVYTRKMPSAGYCGSHFSLSLFLMDVVERTYLGGTRGFAWGR